MDKLPKPNTQALSWFYGEYKNNTLRLTPKYQRNPIWSIGQKCFLIDSLISGTPIPQVFINIINEGIGRNRKTFYEVVDGQQRLRAILEFMLDEYSLVSTTAKSYPVSNEYKPYIGKKYTDLPPHIQDLIWNYPLAVQELRGWDEAEIRALFRRLNYVVEKLNQQELRDLKQRIKSSIKDKFGESVVKKTAFDIPNKLTRTKLLSLINQKGWNITASSAEKLKTKANRLLAAPFAIKFSITSEDSELYDYLKALRNYLGHSSEGARNILKNKISTLNEDANLPLQGKVNNIAVYLKELTTNRLSRTEYIIERIMNIADKL